MKKKLFKAIIAVCLSAAMLVLSAAPAFAYAGDVNQTITQSKTYTREELESYLEEVEESFNYMFTEPGHKWYMPAVEEEEAAIEYAKLVLANPDADTTEITEAYLRLEASLYVSKDAHDYLDERKLGALLDYVLMLVENYKDCFSEDEFIILKDCYGDLMGDWHYGANTQEKVDIAVEVNCSKLNEIERYEDNTDLVWPCEFVKLIELIDANFSKDQDYICDYETFNKNFGGYRLFRASFGLEADVDSYERIGKYIYYVPSRTYPSTVGHILINAQTGELLSLEDGLKSGIVDGDVLYEIYKNEKFKFRFEMSLAGDLDFDGRITISDATEVQMKISYFDDAVDVDDAFFDFNNDGKVDISDATAIQRFIAGFDTEPEPKAVEFETVVNKRYAPDFKSVSPNQFSEVNIVTSAAQLEELVSVDIENITSYQRPDYSSFDDSFFEDNALVVWRVLYPDFNVKLDVNSMEIKGSELVINSTLYCNVISEPMFSYTHVFCSVEKSSIKNVTSVKNNNSVVYIEPPYDH